MVEDLNRKEIYRNKYYEYWHSRVQESNEVDYRSSKIIKTDFVVPSDSIYRGFFEKHLVNNGRILDIGCGWGRFFNYYKKYNMQIYGIDISDIMVKKATELFSEIALRIDEGEAEDLPFSDNYFDVVCCFGVFDATFQDKVIKEMLRVCKLGGSIIFTGKNIRYSLKDEIAYKAELGALNNKEPNYFTNLEILISELIENKHVIINKYYFINRGDMSLNNYVNEPPKEFYEYCLTVKKCSLSYKFSKFYNSKSENFNIKNSI
jgi:ubiquinone/menaquinone biosynthesis C-methylase UbiE|tara:strand:+ start:57 stop:842 length:786 start_codon:yes stop_codon:yes gene_type:complete